MTEWKDIDSAPRDGTEVDLWFAPNAPDGGAIDNGCRVPDCRYRNDESWIDDSGNILEVAYITHWRHKPPPPTTEVGQ